MLSSRIGLALRNGKGTLQPAGSRGTRGLALGQFAFAALLALSGWVPAVCAGADAGAIHLGDAREHGTFNAGAAQAVLRNLPTPGGDRHDFVVEYSLPPGTSAGLWSKRFPENLNAATAEIVRIRVNGKPLQSHKIPAAIEIKGSGGVQRIALPHRAGEYSTEELINWPAIGDLSEVVLVVSALPNAVSAAAGSLSLDLSFNSLPPIRRLSISPVGRVLGVLLITCLAAVILVSVRRWAPTGNIRPRDALPSGGARSGTRLAHYRDLFRDLVLGSGVALTVALALGIHLLGGRGALNAGFTALWIGMAGGMLGGWLKHGLTGRAVTLGELVQDVLASGLLAASACPLALLQMPATWSELLLLNRNVAAVAVAIYHLANTHRLATAGRHLHPTGSLVIAGVPYLVGALVVLQSDVLITTLAGALTAGLWSAGPAVLELLGQLLVVFTFNWAAASLVYLTTQRSLCRSLKVHASLLLTAAAVVAAPRVAGWGSGAEVAGLHPLLQAAIAVAATMLSQAGLWAEVYLITGLVMDALQRKAPFRKSAAGLPLEGVRKGAIYGGAFMALLYGLSLLWRTPGIARLAADLPWVAAATFGALAFPLAKTILETFDGSHGFFRRIAMSYRAPVLYARGTVAGLAAGYWFTQGISYQDTLFRAGFGFLAGAVAGGGVSLVRDAVNGLRCRGGLLTGRAYLVHSLLGGLVGAGIGFYLDATQVSLVLAKFHRYLAAGETAEPYTLYPFLSKWGFLDLGHVTGGVSLLWAEALAGVIRWSIPAWLFAINRTFMAAYFQREAGPIRVLFTRDGLSALAQNMLQVLRWGLWMSPIINSFLRPVGDPTWYNQDGAIHTLWALFQDATTGPDAFRTWSLQVFIYLLAYDTVRVLIWLDHMGLRVATLVNLSFLGMDRLDQRLARFLGRAATAQCIPEGVKRFATWAPLLIPFYIPMARDWDYAWSQAEALRSATEGDGWLTRLASLPLGWQTTILAGGMLFATGAFTLARWLRNRRGPRARSWTLRNTSYEVTLRESGELASRELSRGYDVTRRSYDRLDPAGRAVFLIDPAPTVEDGRPAWPVLGNFPRRSGEGPRIEASSDWLRITSEAEGLRATIEISLPEAGHAVELWTITLENLTDLERPVKLVPYLEWVLNKAEDDRGHTQYNRLFAQMEYDSSLRAIVACDRHSKAVGVLAVEGAPEGFLTSRVDFIGRARSLWSSRVLETLAFAAPRSTAAQVTFDPIAALLVGITLEPRGSATTRLLLGIAKNRQQAAALVARHLPASAGTPSPTAAEATAPPTIGHGEIPPGTPQPYFEYLQDGRTLRVHTPFTPRPFDHALSNRLGHVMAVTNRGLHTTSNWNSQQNRLTPDWPDTVTREVPSEAFYLYEPDGDAWYSPTYHPLNDASARYEVDFRVDGSATYRMTKGTLATELTVFVPPEEPAGVYLLTIKNHADRVRQIRIAPYFQMVLAGQPEHSGPLKVRHDAGLDALFFENPRNTYRTGPAFVAASCPLDSVETRRGRFFGDGRGVAHPLMVERGEPDTAAIEDDRPVAALLATIELPPQGEQSLVVILGQADSADAAHATIRKYRSVDLARAGLAQTRDWWLRLMGTMQVKTRDRQFDGYLDWLKYQALAERIWARRGFYQASGAFGFRDQLQDAINLMWVDPRFARQQILLHASQQFLEGDVVHWFHLLADGRTGFAARTHASDNLLWLAWALAEYVQTTGDDSILDERTPYLAAEQPFPPLPAGKEGMGFVPHRSSRTDSVYRHAMKAIDLVLRRRMGMHGLPLMGTGDWNDGLDEIGSQGKGESVWLGFFLYTILDRLAPWIAQREARRKTAYYTRKAQELKTALQATWRGDRYLRAFHDDGTEIGIAGSGVWEIDALTAAWAVMSGIDPERGRIVFDTAIEVLERENVVLLGWPALREDTKPYLGRSSRYPEGVRENGMYCHGVQWLVGAARILAEQCRRSDDLEGAMFYRQAAWRLWRKISPLAHTGRQEIEAYGGQPNKQAADILTASVPGRMIWHGYTGAAGWMLRQAIEGVLGARLCGGELIAPQGVAGTDGDPGPAQLHRDLSASPLRGSSEDKPEHRGEVYGPSARRQSRRTTIAEVR